MSSEQAGLLAPESSRGSGLPDQLISGLHMLLAPPLQWRDRVGVAPNFPIKSERQLSIAGQTPVPDIMELGQSSTYIIVDIVYRYKRFASWILSVDIVVREADIIEFT